MPTAMAVRSICNSSPFTISKAKSPITSSTICAGVVSATCRATISSPLIAASSATSLLANCSEEHELSFTVLNPTQARPLPLDCAQAISPRITRYPQFSAIQKDRYRSRAQPSRNRCSRSRFHADCPHAEREALQSQSESSPQSPRLRHGWYRAKSPQTPRHHSERPDQPAAATPEQQFPPPAADTGLHEYGHRCH